MTKVHKKFIFLLILEFLFLFYSIIPLSLQNACGPGPYANCPYKKIGFTPFNFLAGSFIILTLIFYIAALKKKKRS